MSEQTLVLHECKVSKRGKGAKGTITVSTFGKPLVVIDGVTKTWDYSEFRSAKLMALIDSLEVLAKDINLCEALVMGVDAKRKSQTLKKQDANNALAEWILSQDLAQDMTDAKQTAKEWVDLNIRLSKAGCEPMTHEDLAKRRKVSIDKMKAAGTWKACLVNDGEIVANKTIVPSDIADTLKEAMSESEEESE